MRTFRQAFAAQARAIFTDGGALLLLVAAPVLYSAFYPLPYLRGVVRDVGLGVVDLDHSAMSRQLARWLAAHPNVSAQAFDSAATGAAALRAGHLGALLVLPAGMERDLLHGATVTLPLMADAGYFLVYRQALGAVLETAGTLGAQIQVGRSLAAGRPLESALAARDPHPLVVRQMFNPTGNYRPYIVPAVYVLILQQTLLIGLCLLAGTARERGQVAGAGPPSHAAAVAPPLLGRTAFLVALYALHALYFFGWSALLFDLPAGGSARHLFQLLVPFLIASAFLGIALGALFREREQAFGWLLFTSLPLLFVSGSIWPVEAMPGWMPWFAGLFPSTPAIRGVLALVAMDAPWDSVARHAVHLWLLAGLFAVPAYFAQRRASARVADA